jgi:hypothetical protein
MTDCNHVNLKLLGGPIHPNGKDYYCLSCGQQFRVEEANITVSFGKPPSQAEREGR